VRKPKTAQRGGFTKENVRESLPGGHVGTKPATGRKGAQKIAVQAIGSRGKSLVLKAVSVEYGKRHSRKTCVNEPQPGGTKRPWRESGSIRGPEYKLQVLVKEKGRVHEG